MKPRGNRREKNRVTSNGKQHGHPETPRSTLASNSATCSSDVNNIKDEEDIFPRFSPWVVCALTMAIRVNYVCQPKNWWILHPDEIFQTLEVAHSEVYGYGFRTHEYLSVPGDMNMTEMRYSEVKMGMHSMRSFLLPRFFIMVSWLAGMLRYSGRPFMLWKVAHVLVTSCLPLSVYKFSRTLFRSHDIGVLSAILTATNTQLSVFGTHTLINSFIGTPLFYALSLLLENMLCVQTIANISSVEDTMQHRNSVDNKETLYSHIDAGELLNGTLIANGSCKRNDGHWKMHGMTRGTGNDNPFSPDLNGITNGILLTNGSVCAKENRDKNLYIKSDADRRVDQLSQLPDESHNTYEQRDVNMNIILDRHISKPNSDETKPESLLCASFLIVLCCYIRVDVTLFIMVTVFPFLNRKWLRKDRIVLCVIGAFGGLFLGVLDDYISYGIGVISPYNWFQFNVVRDFSAVIYGRMNWTWYFTPLFYENPVLAVLLLISVATLLMTGLTNKRGFNFDKMRYKTVLKLSISLVIMTIIYSTKGHKELRFLYNVLVLVSIVFAYCIYIIVNHVVTTRHSLASHTCLIIPLITYILSQWFAFPSSMDNSIQTWTYTGNTKSHDVITCFDYVRKQNDVTGVFSDQMVHMSGGYTVLHKNVPILSLVHYEFYEFSFETRTTIQSADLFTPKRNISLSTFTQTSEFVSIYSTSYLLKLFLGRKVYNYVIINNDRPFLPSLFEEVFRSGEIRVLKWKKLKDDEVRQLDLFASSIPLGANATLLIYEAQWLLKFNQIKLAKQRLVKALDLEPKSVEAYKLLAWCYTVLGNPQSSSVVVGKCMTVHSKKLCYENPNRILLHDEYRFSW